MTSFTIPNVELVVSIFFTIFSVFVFTFVVCISTLTDILGNNSTPTVTKSPTPTTTPAITKQTKTITVENPQTVFPDDGYNFVFKTPFTTSITQINSNVLSASSTYPCLSQVTSSLTGCNVKVISCANATNSQFTIYPINEVFNVLGYNSTPAMYYRFSPNSAFLGYIYATSTSGISFRAALLDPSEQYITIFKNPLIVKSVSSSHFGYICSGVTATGGRISLLIFSNLTLSFSGSATFSALVNLRDSPIQYRFSFVSPFVPILGAILADSIKLWVSNVVNPTSNANWTNTYSLRSNVGAFALNTSISGTMIVYSDVNGLYFFSSTTAQPVQVDWGADNLITTVNLPTPSSYMIVTLGSAARPVVLWVNSSNLYCSFGTAVVGASTWSTPIILNTSEQQVILFTLPRASSPTAFEVTASTVYYSTSEGSLYAVSLSYTGGIVSIQSRTIIVYKNMPASQAIAVDYVTPSIIGVAYADMNNNLQYIQSSTFLPNSYKISYTVQGS